jgi:hypothetical protein
MKPNYWDFPNFENITSVTDHFMNAAKKFEHAYHAAHRLHERLRAEGIPYVLVGGMAVHLHGYERHTSDVDILITHEGHVKLLNRLIGHGYEVSKSNPSRIVDQENGAEIDLCFSDGSARWPQLFGNSIDIGPISVITLPRLIDMKLSAGRLEDTVDVVKLIKHHRLPKDFANQLAEEVRERWDQIWPEGSDSE